MQKGVTALFFGEEFLVTNVCKIVIFFCMF
jgi:hypothetical protein